MQGPMQQLSCVTDFSICINNVLDLVRLCYYAAAPASNAVKLNATERLLRYSEFNIWPNQWSDNTGNSRILLES